VGIQSAITAPSHQRDLALRARQAIESRFTFDARMAKMAEIYSNLLSL
jgi:hypothetical protein